MLTDYHIHIENGPYTLAWLKRFVQVAHAAGVSEMGIVEHTHRYREFAPVMATLLDGGPWTEMARDYLAQCQDGDLQAYLDLAREARAAGWGVRFGLEVDYVPGCEAAIQAFLAPLPLDFVLGSVHWLGAWGFDHPAMLDEWGRRTPEAVYGEYYGLIAQAARSGLFDIVGHLDVVKIFGHAPQDALAPADEAVAALAAAGMAVEVNAAGLRKPVQEIYPGPALLALCHERGLPIVLSSDAHWPEDVGAGLEAAREAARQAGYTSVQVFCQRARESRLL